MSSRFILSFFRIAVSILLYLLICVSLFILFTTFAGRYGTADYNVQSSYNYEVKRFTPRDEAPSYAYSADSLVRYRPMYDRYTVNVQFRSGIGYYLLVMKLLLLGFGIAILWNFRQLFRKRNLDEPFRHEVIKRLKWLALLFIVSDLVKLVDYFVFNQLLRKHIPARFELLTSVGDGIITGLIIYLIVVVFQHGIQLQEENALTV